MNPHDRALLEAAARGDEPGVSAALAAGAAVDARDEQLRTALLLAALADHVGTAALLVAAGADPDAPDARADSPWLVTGVTGSVRMMRTLLPAGPDLTQPNRFGGTSLIPASERGHTAYVRAVLAETAIAVDHVNRLGWTALLEAVILGDGGPRHEEVARLLLAAGADPGLGDLEGVTPYEHAVRRGFDGMARLLRTAAGGPLPGDAR
ncbi:ankyrin repeat domain-containing protein [Streptomyces sp. NBC_00249]|uniref:ankyrin repeat domain-containing protein n=1 Tax=Streptomyces sp. NBC_00249 TaxID=2975690 RepID=UPI002259F8A9|nr:ankyrin repeat domain-containing protein [Streptomyces sp. NBC_00249]MCX5192618.1 ankyrin repeat domain-containing protein [Streptomyces sp. NBC_00249]